MALQILRKGNVEKRWISTTLAGLSLSPPTAAPAAAHQEIFHRLRFLYVAVAPPLLPAMGHEL